MSYESYPEDLIQDRINKLDRVNKALKSATDLAIETAFSHGVDFPVGAVACCGGFESGRWFASDQRNIAMGVPRWKAEHNHAEFMAVGMAKLQPHGRVDLLAVNIEPCARCFRFLAAEHVKTVAFVIPRTELEERGLVNPRPGEHIFELAEKMYAPINIMQFDDPVIRAGNYALLDSTTRDKSNGKVTVDKQALSARLQTINESLD